ncbi:MAG TPA: hypothetical protein VKA46_32910 [Gemmataceae bacterium]|nr:hypothetical protein [Gemmataceae bacterium]
MPRKTFAVVMLILLLGKAVAGPSDLPPKADKVAIVSGGQEVSHFRRAT